MWEAVVIKRFASFCARNDASLTLSADACSDVGDDDGSAAGSRRLRGIIVPRRALWWTVPRRAIRGGGASTLGDGSDDDDATSERCGARSATPAAVRARSVSRGGGGGSRPSIFGEQRCEAWNNSKRV